MEQDLHLVGGMWDPDLATILPLQPNSSTINKSVVIKGVFGWGGGIVHNFPLHDMLFSKEGKIGEKIRKWGFYNKHCFAHHQILEILDTEIDLGDEILKLCVAKKNG